jgi:hypothetical protein
MAPKIKAATTPTIADVGDRDHSTTINVTSSSVPRFSEKTFQVACQV